MAENERQQDLEDLEVDPNNFAPGTFGFHELVDRLLLQQVQWEQFCLRHPSSVLDAEIYALAWDINEKMADLYQKAGVKHGYFGGVEEQEVDQSQVERG